MKVYFRAFVNFKQNDWARLLLMAEFTYNNAKNASTDHISFELNCGYHPCVFYEKDFDLHSKSKTVEEISSELQELMAMCQQNLHHTQELQKQVHNKSGILWSYISSNKVWLSNKHLKTKWNCKLKVKFLGSFWVLYPIGK